MCVSDEQEPAYGIAEVLGIGVQDEAANLCGGVLTARATAEPPSFP